MPCTTLFRAGMSDSEIGEQASREEPCSRVRRLLLRRQWQGKFCVCRKSCAALCRAIAGAKPVMNTRPRPSRAAMAIARVRSLVPAVAAV